MKKIKSLSVTIIITLTFVTLFTNCGINEPEYEDATFKVSFIMKTKSISTQKTTAPNSLEFKTGYVIISEIVFDGEKKDGQSISITHEQISTIDLQSGLANPAVNVIIPFGEYSSVNLGIEIQDEDDTPSVVAEGIYTDAGGIEIPLRFEFNSGEVFEANAIAHTFPEGSSAIAEIDYSPAVWFSTITGTMLDDAERVNGIILINESTNSNIFDIVADKLDEATQAEFK